MHEPASAAIQNARHLLLDWDGCLVNGRTLGIGARALLAAFDGRVTILSNNSTHLPHELAAFLRRHGVTVPDEAILLAGHRTLLLAAAQCRGETVFLVGNGVMERAARQLGVRLGRDASTVLLLRDTALTYARLAHAVNLLHRGASLIVANPDAIHRVPGAIVPETGALLASVAACLDLARVPTTIVGKPDPRLFAEALARARVTPGEALMVGDNPATDGEGAARAGVPFLLLDPPAGVTLRTLAAALRRQTRRRGPRGAAAASSMRSPSRQPTERTA